MKLFLSFTNILAVVACVAGTAIPDNTGSTVDAATPVVDTTPAIPKWISVEYGQTDLRNATTADSTVSLEKRAGTPVTTCYNEGTSVYRGIMTSVIDDYCSNRLIGTMAFEGIEHWARYAYNDDVTVLVSFRMINGCAWRVDTACYGNFRYPVDSCNTDGVNYKQGGYMTDLCAVWRADPGSGGNDQ